MSAASAVTIFDGWDEGFLESFLHSRCLVLLCARSVEGTSDHWGGVIFTAYQPSILRVSTMAPPSYTDLGKSCNDLFKKGYNFGFLKIETTAKSGNNGELEFKTGAAHNVSSQKLNGNMDIKYKIPAYGITITEKWNTDNVLGTTVDVQDQLARGTKLTFDSTYAPHIGKRSAKVKAEWVNPNAKVNADVSLDGGPIVNLAAVIGHGQWLIGVQSGLDVASNKLKATNFALGHQGQDYTVHTFMNNASELGCSVFHRPAKNVELGGQLGWTIGDKTTNFGLAAKYAPSADLIFRGKVDNKSNVALAATHSVSKDVKLTVSTQFALTGVEGTQKFGLGLEYTP
uniref:Voltage-dependent anion-selective channel protein 1 n=1 Tax=Steinernema glaseri TaxID=37863 RepID=A0A1I7YYJ7_9BILA